ncbi:hypothetical protein IGB42_00036 [Andreprevotia sp. IGB-42]|nr:hypothetical protein IGB42_00036 [Andreprevotia sp. IGB-42]
MLSTLLLGLSGCSKAELPAYRENYILAKDHGWIELTVDIPATVIKQPRKGEPASCGISVYINGENYLVAPLPVTDKLAANLRSGFLFPAPANDLDVTVTSDCSAAEQPDAQLQFKLDKDSKAGLLFDGTQLHGTGTTKETPATLAGLQDDMTALHAKQTSDSEGNAAAFTWQTRLLAGGFALVTVLLLVLIFKRK